MDSELPCKRRCGLQWRWQNKKSLLMKDTLETKHRAMLLDSWTEFLFVAKINDDKQPRFLVGWALGHKDTDIITLIEYGSVRFNGSWKYSPEGRNDANVHELQSALADMKNTKPKVQGCLACEHGINVNLGRKHTFECRQTILPLVTDSLCTVNFDADTKVLKRHEHAGDDEHRDSKRV